MREDGGDKQVKYVYAALLLHSSGKKVDEEALKKVIVATGGQVEEARVKALVASLSEVNIDDALKAAPMFAAAAPAAPAAKPADKKAEPAKSEAAKPAAKAEDKAAKK